MMRREEDGSYWNSGKKIGMTQVFDDKGDVHPITVLQAGPRVITQLKSAAKDGDDAAQIGLVEFVKAGKITKPQAGHFAKNDVAPVKLVREVPVETPKAPADGEASNGHVKAGDRVLVDIFSDEKYVDVIGTSKGRGFAGVVRRRGLAAVQSTTYAGFAASITASQQNGARPQPCARVRRAAGSRPRISDVEPMRRRICRRIWPAEGASVRRGDRQKPVNLERWRQTAARACGRSGSLTDAPRRPANRTRE